MLVFKPHGRHLIAGQWVATDTKFTSEPAHGPAHEYSVGTPGVVDQATRAAEAAFESFGQSTRDQRAGFLETIADCIDARAKAITEIGCQETGLPPARLESERGRTMAQLRLFADHIRSGDYLDQRRDHALPDRQPAPRPETRMMQRPVGPVAVFGASNFPLAFSTAGGDTAAALAAGCPVIVKGHSAHPGTGEIVAEAVLEAVQKCDLYPGVFSLIQGGNRQVGESLVTHPLVKAVGFTGSLAGGRALFDLCASRPEPIPFFGELSSVNPVFLLPGAVKTRAQALAREWVASLAVGAGQLCTNPGIAVLVDGDDARQFIAAVKAELSALGPQTMLTDGIAAAYQDGQKRFQDSTPVRPVFETVSAGREARPNLYEVAGADFLANPSLHHEVFGPLGLLVKVDAPHEMLEIAGALGGQLTATMQMESADLDLARQLLPVVERRVGRILVNGFPTGVEVVGSMVHGGPYPASTNFGATSVGTMSIRRFLRPVCYQNFPEGLLPVDLQDENL